MARRDDSSISLPALALVLPPVAVFLVSDALVGWFAWRGARPPLMHAAGQADAAARLYILSALLICLGAAFLTLLLFARDLLREFGPAMRCRLIVTLAGGLAIGSAWIVFSSHWLPPAESLLGKGLFERVTAIFEPARYGASISLFDRLRALIGLGRIALMLGAGVVIVGAVSCMAHPLADWDEISTREFLLRQRQRLRTYVNAAAMLMVAAIALLLAWTRWPIILMNPHMAKMHLALVDALSVYQGVTLSLVIAIFAIPVATTLDAKLAGLPVLADVSAAPSQGGLFDALGKILVVLAPALASAIPAFVDLARPLG